MKPTIKKMDKKLVVESVKKIAPALKPVKKIVLKKKKK